MRETDGTSAPSPAPSPPAPEPAGAARAGRIDRITLAMVLWTLGAFAGMGLARGPLRGVSLPCPFCVKTTVSTDSGWSWVWCDHRRLGLTGVHVVGLLAIYLLVFRPRAASRPDLLDASASWQRRLALALIVAAPLLAYGTLPRESWEITLAHEIAWASIAGAAALLCGSLGSFWTRVVGATVLAATLAGLHASWIDVHAWQDVDGVSFPVILALLVTPFAVLVIGPWAASAESGSVGGRSEGASPTEPPGP